MNDLTWTKKFSVNVVYYLITGQFADNSTVADPFPKHVSFSKEIGIEFTPVFPQGPRKDVVFFFFFVLFHIVCKVPGK